MRKRFERLKVIYSMILELLGMSMFAFSFAGVVNAFVKGNELTIKICFYGTILSAIIGTAVWIMIKNIERIIELIKLDEIQKQNEFLEFLERSNKDE